MSCGLAAPSMSGSPARTRSPSRTERCLPLEIRYSLRLADLGRDDHLALALGVLAERDDAVDLGDDRVLLRLARLEELGDARQTAGDVLGLGGLARDLGDDVAGLDGVAVVDVDVRADRAGSNAPPAFEPGIFLVLPCSSLIEMRGRVSASFDSMMTLRERPVTSSSCSCIVTPSMMSPYFTTPPTSVRIGIENGSHSDEQRLGRRPSAPSSTRSLAP